LNWLIDNDEANNKQDDANSELHDNEANNKQPDTITECFSSLKKNNLSFPFAYSTLLTVTTWVFSLSLSFQLVSDLQWLTIPIIFLSTLFLFGIIELAEQIENPFGIDIFDADLNKFCVDIWIDTKFIMDNTAEIKKFCDDELDKIKVFEEQKSSQDKAKM
ncbi:17265_t:CDS:2, partial [Gigaspora margarita]